MTKLIAHAWVPILHGDSLGNHESASFTAHVLSSPGRVVPTVHHPAPCLLAPDLMAEARDLLSGALVKCDRTGCDRCVYVPPAR